MFRVVFTKVALKALRRMPQNTARLIRKKIDQLASDPQSPGNQVTHLTNRPEYRLRIGDWRVIYDLREQELVILVLKIAP
ncbi:MAG: type II toxin-antitoxin system RelE/ParE family toxin, partial [Mariprofundaceae bacterium]|nr:type II toxin-antitoxin system RelE/ParE family toxin [Mariprofundaceae bacterium]